MPASLKLEVFPNIADLLRRRKLATASTLSVAAVLLIGPLVWKSASFELLRGQAANWHDPSWAGGLEAPKSQARLAAEGSAEKPLTSASYTSGFDEKAAGLGPLPPEARTPAVSLRNSLACPDGLNCSFRTAKSAPLPYLHRVAAADPKPVKTAAAKSSFSLSLLPVHLSWPTPRLTLPSANTLLTPFSYVGNTVVGFVKKL